MSPERAQAIYHEWNNRTSSVTMRSLARRYRTSVGTITNIVTAQHRHTQHLTPIHTPKTYRRPEPE